jgi:hypothetical protein
MVSESSRRGRTLPRGFRFAPPDWAMWERGFTRLRRAAGPLGAKCPSYPDAVAVAQALLDPVFSGERDEGAWDAETRRWIDGPVH